ncbi:hypothetical protein HY969_05040 [Candidatus Kaiserbacteria bacterium]|nr:hypothetical protein [Candidatus Kaiserbacteria bacterium]
MQPLSSRTRRVYLYALMLLFVVLLPMVIFYADGYRYRPGVGFRQTGGIFIAVPYSGTNVLLNGEHIGTTSFLQRSFYIDNLTTGTYTVLAEREDSIPWIRALFVEPQLVTDVRVQLVPQRVQTIRLVTAPSNATTTRTILSSELADIRQEFSTPAATTTAGLSGDSLIVEEGNVYDRITQVDALPPSNFCSQPSRCFSEIPIEGGQETSTSAAFFRGGVVYATAEGGIYFAEADIRPSPATTKVYPIAGTEFRIVGDLLIVKDGSSFYEIVGL